MKRVATIGRAAKKTAVTVSAGADKSAVTSVGPKSLAAASSKRPRVPATTVALDEDICVDTDGRREAAFGGHIAVVTSSSSRGHGAAAPPWREQLARIQVMRALRDAPVDTMGCERCADLTAPPHVQRFQHLVSLMLSPQTKDPVVFAAMNALKAQPRGGCTAQALAALSESALGALINKVGFWPTKARAIHEAAVLCAAPPLSGDIPCTYEELLELRGVGPKIAHILMLAAWKKCTGIGVDTHVHRISNRLDWVKTKTPEETRVALEALLPREEWAPLNVLFVGFGQQRCTPLTPACDGCAVRDICPTGRRGGGAKKKVPDW